MSLNRSALFPVHGATNATFAGRDGWLVAASFSGLEPECAAVRTQAGVYDLTDQGVMTLIGPDARRFSNGMFTNNLRDLSPGQANASAMVDERARLQGLLRMYALSPESFLAVLEGVTPAAFAKRYGTYIIFDDVELEDASEEHALLSLQGPDAADVLVALGLPVPPHTLDRASHAESDGVRVARHDRSPAGGYDLLVRRDSVAPLWAALVSRATPVGADAREVLRIEAGIPRWPVDMTEKSLLHELRLVPTHANFNKGCYIGQEVINRIDVMGQVTKKLWGLTLEEDALPRAGAEVRLGDEVVGATFSGAREGSRVRVLALLRKSAWEPGLRVTVHAGERVVGAVVSDLPF